MSGTRLAALYRVCVKCYAAEYTIENDAEVFVPVFHDWIRDRALDLVMLDVADYAHAPDSPGIMLVCHEASFALDRSDGRLGLLCQRRLPFDGTASEGIVETVRQTLDVAARLEADPRIRGKLRFDPTRLRIEANDRLLAPNSSEGFRDFAALVRAAIATAFGVGEPVVEKIDNDPRDRLALFVRLHAVRG